MRALGNSTIERGGKGGTQGGDPGKRRELNTLGRQKSKRKGNVGNARKGLRKGENKTSWRFDPKDL